MTKRWGGEVQSHRPADSLDHLSAINHGCLSILENVSTNVSGNVECEDLSEHKWEAFVRKNNYRLKQSFTFQYVKYELWELKNGIQDETCWQPLHLWWIMWIVCERQARLFPPQPAIKARLAKVRLTDRLTDLQITVCLCNPQPFLLPSLTDALTPPI